MPNLKIALPQANANSPVQLGPKSGVKGAAPEKGADTEFETKLKQGLAETAKKEAVKKAVSATAPATALTAQAAEFEKIAKLVEEEKSEKISGDQDGKKEKSASIEKGGAAKQAVSQMTAQTLEISGLNKLEPAQPLNAKEAADEKNATPAEKSAVSSKSDLLRNQAQADASVSLVKTMNGPGGATTKLDLTQLQGVQASANNELDSDFEIESLDLKEATAGSKDELLSFGTKEVDTKRAPVSKLSTADYLNLRDLAKKDSISLQPQTAVQAASGLGTKKGKLELLTGKDGLAPGAGFSQNLQANQAGPKLMEATVTQGAAGKPVLSHDSVHQLTNTVNMMNMAKQDGEIKIRLRPDHLGELQMSVKTQGNQVAIQIRAQSGEAKRIIEESLGSLKDSFAKQNLNLAQVDVVTAPTQSQTQEQGMQMDFAGSRQNFGQDGRDFSQGGQNARQDRLYEDAFTSSNLNTAQAARVSRYSANQGLDLIA